MFASLFTGAEPDFELVGRRLLPDGAARFIEELAKPQRQRATMVLAHWLSRNRRHASLFQGADIPVLMRNLALIQLRLVRRARGIDLSEADLSRLSLDGADFTGSQLGGASFRGANVSRARFYDAVLVGATFAGADVTDARFARARTDLADLPDVEDAGR